MGVDIYNSTGIIFTLEQMYDMFLSDDEGAGFIAAFNEVLEEAKQEEAEQIIELKDETAEYEKKLAEYEEKHPEHEKKTAIFNEAWEKWRAAGEDENTLNEVQKLRPEQLWKPQRPFNSGTQARESLEEIAKTVKEGEDAYFEDEASNLSLQLCKDGNWDELPQRVWSKYLEKINDALPSFEGVQYFDQGGRYNGYEVPQEEWLYVFDTDDCYETTLSDAGKALEEIAGEISPTEWTVFSN